MAKIQNTEKPAQVTAEELKRYLALPYHIVLRPDEDDEGTYWIAGISELHGCETEGRTQAEAMTNLEDAKRTWIRWNLEHGHPVPEPAYLEDVSGRLLLRMPKSLHRSLVLAAERERTSLNQYIVKVLAERGTASRAVEAELREVQRQLAALTDKIAELERQPARAAVG